MPSATVIPIRPLYVRVPAACSYIGIGKTTLYKLLKNGDVRAVKLGVATLIDLASIDAMLASLPTREA